MDGLVAGVVEGSEILESGARGEGVVSVEVEEGDDDRLASSQGWNQGLKVASESR